MDPSPPHAFPITRKRPPQHPDRLQRCSLPTPDGVKVSIALEGCCGAGEPVGFESFAEVRRALAAFVERPAT